jgi:hypothetical protein
MDLAGRAAGHREILTGDVNGPAADSSAAGDYAVGRERLAGHAEVGGAMLGEHAQLLQAVAIEKILEPLARGQFSFEVLLVGPFGASALPQLIFRLLEGGDFLLGQFGYRHIRMLTSYTSARRRPEPTVRLSEMYVRASNRARRGCGANPRGGGGRGSGRPAICRRSGTRGSSWFHWRRSGYAALWPHSGGREV